MPRRLLLPVLLLLLPAASPGQTVEVTAPSENFRQEPNGKLLATVNRGAPLEVVDRQGSWRRVALAGWIWSPSVSPSDRSGFDLVVSSDGGENLRSAPDASAGIRARLLEGFLLEKLEERGNWTNVRRVGWMWAPSLGAAGESETAPVAAESGTGTPSEGGEERGRADGGRPELPDRLVVSDASATLFLSPDGQELAALRPETDLIVLARRGEWTRVRVEGWVRSRDVDSAEAAGPSETLTVEDVRENPETYRGRRVDWTLQFISLERAEPVRTDFYEGEPFILARPLEPASGFVYVAVPPELVSRVERLSPLERIGVRARVRTGRSALMGAPVVDLLELRRAQRR